MYLGNGCSDRKNNDIFDPWGVEESLIGQFWPHKAWWCQISHKNNFGLLFQKWSLCTQESFCKVSDQLDTQLNNYGLISRHTSINCVNNCTFIFTRHQPRLFLKALLVINSFLIPVFSRLFKISIFHTIGYDTKSVTFDEFGMSHHYIQG